ncbi:MAG TPA: CPBP family intramembrane glutamic endopeptidase [Solirubrobacteraceae bacterium]|nr:CPBP family intramembrane glutamic endopeptidase [Solirubrobacteraceae bacterium]
MTTVPPPSDPPASLHTHPEVPAGIVPAERPPEPPAGTLAAVPAWAPLAAMIVAFVVATIAYLLIAAVVEAAGGTVTSGGPPGLVISATLVQDAALIVAALLFSSMWARGLTPASFGLRPTRLGPAIGWTLLTFVAFWVLTALYISAVGEPDQQELTRDLREEESLAALIGYGVLLAFVAPVAEELFFRGFVFGVLREKIGAAGGAIATGVVFGLVHVAGSPIETVGVLVILGVLLCVLYLQTGSLLPCIALHAINNSISFAVTKELPIPAAILIVLGSTTAAVAVAVAVMRRRPALPGVS